MNIKVVKTMIAAVPLILCSQFSNAAVTNLADDGFAINIDGSVSTVENQASFNYTSGLGTLSFNISGAGSHSFDAFFDHEIDQGTNGLTNETGSATGTAAAGQSWEIDEPGWVDGDIYVNFQNSLLDNLIGQSIFGNAASIDDMSMAMGWDFTLDSTETAVISLLLSETDNGGGFFLTQSDPDSQSSIFLSSSLTIQGGAPQIPEPSVIWLIGLGLLGFATQHKLKKTA